MASDTKKVETIRRNKRAATGRTRKAKVNRKGTTRSPEELFAKAQ